MSDPLLLLPANLLRRYHDHKVNGLEHIPKKGGALVVVNHSLATYDLFMLGAAIYTERHRLVHALGHKWLFQIPGLRAVMRDAGAVPAAMDAGLKLLRDGHLLGIAPGGMREALRSSEERYRLRWTDRKGFVRLAIRSQCPIVLAACPRADEIFDVKTTVLTDVLYERFRLPFAFFKGIGPLPRPVPLTHTLRAPLTPPMAPKGAKAFEKLVDEWHAYVTEVMETLMDRARRA
jgi:1-acyl-sn-glycerol-3-phosphate acyltransferase